MDYEVVVDVIWKPCLSLPQYCLIYTKQASKQFKMNWKVHEVYCYTFVDESYIIRVIKPYVEIL